MSQHSINKLLPNTVLYLYTERKSFDLNPVYQRQSDIWNIEKRQLLIDSIINGYDIPKLYFHKYPRPHRKGSHGYQYAIIDGKQRLESIWGFIDKNFALSEQSEYIRDSKVKLAGLTYTELGQKYPDLKIRFDSFPLDIITVETDDVELIEDMFSRLNEAVPLNAAEKRIALGGPMPSIIKSLAKHDFFVRNLPFWNRRYRHYDLAAKFLMISEKDKIVDTKKIYLDTFVIDWKKREKAQAYLVEKKAKKVLDSMTKIFTKADPILRSVGMITLYYHLFRISLTDMWVKEITRKKLIEFDEARNQNREKAEQNIASADYDLLEFDRYIQAPNDAYATELRLQIILKKVFNRQ